MNTTAPTAPDAGKSRLAPAPEPLHRGDIVDIRNTTPGGKEIIEGRAAIVSTIRGQSNRFNVRFHSDGHRMTYPRFVLPEHRLSTP